MSTDRTSFWAIAAALAAASVLYCLPLFNNLDHWGRQDWDQFTFRYATPRVALLRDHVLPTWNPYAAGGNVLLAHPDSPVLSPWYLVVLVFGAPLGLRLQVVLFMTIGSVGMAALARRLGASPLGSIAGGVVFMMSSHFALHIAEGHLEWCVLGLMPWVALLLRMQTRRAVVGAALLFATALTFGSVYVPAIFMPFFGLWMLAEALRRRRLAPVVQYAAFIVISALLAAPKLLPVVAFTSDHPREQSKDVDAPVSLWPTMFGDHRQAKFYQAYRDRDLPAGHFAKTLTAEEARPFLATLDAPGLQFNFQEFGCYVGAAGILLAVVGLVSGGRRLWPLYLAGVAAGLMILGANGPVNLWNALQQLPLYQQLRVPSRFLMAVVFVLAIAAAFGMTAITDAGRTRSRARHAAALVLLVLLYGELLSIGRTLFGDIFVVPAIAGERHAGFAQRCDRVPEPYVEVIDSAMYPCLLENSGVLNAYENLTVKTGRVRLEHDPAYRGEAYLEAANGTATVRSWTMSTVTIRVAATGEGRLVMNQNFDSGWRATVRSSNGMTSEPRPERNEDGLVSVLVGPGVSEVEFKYVARGFAAGLAVFVPTLACCLAFLARRRVTPGTVPALA